MACAMRERLIVEGPEALEAHLGDCARCAADVARLDEGMAHLWDALDTFVEADAPPLVVAPAPAVPASPPARWPAVALVLAAAAVLVALLQGPPQAVRPPAPAPAVDETPAVRPPLPLEGALDAEQVRPRVPAPPAAPEVAEAEVPLPPPPCPEAAVWWRLDALVPADCREGFVAVAGGASYELHRILVGDREAPWMDDPDGDELRAHASREVLRLSQEGRHGDATLLVVRLVEHPLFQTRSLWRAGALAARDWMRAAPDAGEANARREVALELAEGWVGSYRYDNDDSDVMARTVRDGLLDAAER